MTKEEVSCLTVSELLDELKHYLPTGKTLYILMGEMGFFHIYLTQNIYQEVDDEDHFSGFIVRDLLAGMLIKLKTERYWDVD